MLERAAVRLVLVSSCYLLPATKICTCMSLFIPSCYIVYFIKVRNSSLSEWSCGSFRLLRCSGNADRNMHPSNSAWPAESDLDQPGYCAMMGSLLSFLVCLVCAENPSLRGESAFCDMFFVKLCVSVYWWYQGVLFVLTFLLSQTNFADVLLKLGGTVKWISGS